MMKAQNISKNEVQDTIRFLAGEDTLSIMEKPTSPDSINGKPISRSGDTNINQLDWLIEYSTLFFIIFGVLLVSVGGLIYLLIYNKLKAKKQLSKTNKHIRELKDQNEYFRSERIGLESKLQYLKAIEEENDKLRAVCKRLKQQLESKAPLPTKQAQTTAEHSALQSSTLLKANLYADAINDGEFYNLSQQPGDMSVFELELPDTLSLSATFKVYSRAEKRVIDRPNYLAGCEKEVIGNKSLETIALGEAHKSGERWIIDKPLKVKII